MMRSSNPAPAAAPAMSELSFDEPDLSANFGVSALEWPSPDRDGGTGPSPFDFDGGDLSFSSFPFLLPESDGGGCVDELGGDGEVLLPEPDGVGGVWESPLGGGGDAGSELGGPGGGGAVESGGGGDGLLFDGGGPEDESGGGGDEDESGAGGDVDVSDGGGEAVGLSDDIFTILYSSEENDRANPYLSPKLMTPWSKLTDIHQFFIFKSKI